MPEILCGRKRQQENMQCNFRYMQESLIDFPWSGINWMKNNVQCCM